jgi:hypothetical protein
MGWEEKDHGVGEMEGSTGGKEERNHGRGVGGGGVRVEGPLGGGI